MVDGRNLAKQLRHISKMFTIDSMGYLPYQLVQDFCLVGINSVWVDRDDLFFALPLGARNSLSSSINDMITKRCLIINCSDGHRDVSQQSS